MGSEIVVVCAPSFNQYLGHLQGGKNLTDKQLISHLSIDGFNVAILPRTTRFDELRFDMVVKFALQN
jgi:hypothetical protein